MSDEETTEIEEVSETEETTEATQVAETTEKSHEPPEGSKRWNEIYYENKETKRQLNDLNETMEALVDHNKALQDSMDSVVDKVATSERPDPIVDPDGYDKWIVDKIKRDTAPKAEPKPLKPPTKDTQNRIIHMEEALRDVYADYDEVISHAKPDLQDPIVGKKIMSSNNPPKAAYDYGKSKMAEAEKARGKKIDGVSVESGTSPVSDKPTVLTAAEKNVANMLGISDKQYIAQKNHIDAQRG